MNTIIDFDDGGEGTTPQAVDSLKIEAAIFGHLSDRNSQLPTHRISKELAAVDVTGRPHTDLDGCRAGLGKTILGVEGRYTIDLVLRDPQEMRSPLYCVLRDVSELLLNPQQNSDEIAFFAFEGGEYLAVLLIIHFITRLWGKRVRGITSYSSSPL